MAHGIHVLDGSEGAEVAGHDRRQMLRMLGLGTVGALSLGATIACDPTRRVLVLGDSLTLSARNQGLGRDHPWDWIISAEEGRTTNRGIAVAKERSISSYDLVVVALGTNDYLDTKSVYGTRVNNMMAALAAAPRVIWVNVDTATTKLAPAAVGVNPALAAAPARHPKLVVADWHRYLQLQPNPNAYRLSDGVHYTAAGYALRARWMEGLVTG